MMMLARYVDNGDTKSVLIVDGRPHTGQVFYAHNVISFRVYGETYKARKNRVRDIAYRYQVEDWPGLSWGECAEVESWLETMGRRYGLLEEFKDNGVL